MFGAWLGLGLAPGPWGLTNRGLRLPGLVSGLGPVKAFKGAFEELQIWGLRFWGFRAWGFRVLGSFGFIQGVEASGPVYAIQSALQTDSMRLSCDVSSRPDVLGSICHHWTRAMSWVVYEFWAKEAGGL